MFSGDFAVRHSSIAKDGDQKVRLEYIFDTRQAGKNHKVRITIVSDAYRNQCSAVAERFNGTSWQKLGSLATANISTQEGLCYVAPKSIEVKMFEQDIKALQTIITAVLS